MSQHTGGLLCPACRVDLVMSERNGVEIDYCPRCRGVWLDRGELDKILERAGTELGGARPAGPPAGQYRKHDSDEYPAYGHGHQGHHHKKRRSFLDDVFDFD